MPSYNLSHINDDLSHIIEFLQRKYCGQPDLLMTAPMTDEDGVSKTYEKAFETFAKYILILSNRISLIHAETSSIEARLRNIEEMLKELLNSSKQESIDI